MAAAISSIGARPLSNYLFDFCKYTELQPRTQIGGEFAVSRHDKSAVSRCGANGRISEPNLGHYPQIS
jgi:hypothetical protein